MRQVTPTELQEYLDIAPQQPLLLDVREEWEFEECHIEGARLLPMNRIPAEYQQLDPARETVVICHHGMRSAQVVQFLEQKGFTNVMNLAGGIDAWAREVDTDMPRY